MGKILNWIAIGLSFIIFLFAINLAPEGALDGDNDD